MAYIITSVKAHLLLDLQYVEMISFEYFTHDDDDHLNDPIDSLIQYSELILIVVGSI